MRSVTGTKSGPPSRVTRPTNSTIARFALLSFHDRRTSAVAGAGAVVPPCVPGDDAGEPPHAHRAQTIRTGSKRFIGRPFGHMSRRSPHRLRRWSRYAVTLNQERADLLSELGGAGTPVSMEHAACRVTVIWQCADARSR